MLCVSKMETILLYYTGTTSPYFKYQAKYDAYSFCLGCNDLSIYFFLNADYNNDHS